MDPDTGFGAGYAADRLAGLGQSAQRLWASGNRWWCLPRGETVSSKWVSVGNAPGTQSERSVM